MLAPVHFDQKIVRKNDTDIGADHAGQVVTGRRSLKRVCDQLLGAIAIQLTAEVPVEQAPSYMRAAQRQGVGISIPSFQAQVGQTGLRAQRPRQPIGLGINACHRSEHGASQPTREPSAPAAFGQVVRIAGIAAESFVPTVSREHHFDASTGQSRY